MHISGIIHQQPDPERAKAFRIADDLVSYCHRRDAGRAKNLTAQASAKHRANQDASALWMKAAAEWEAIGMAEGAEACRLLAAQKTPKLEAAE